MEKRVLWLRLLIVLVAMAVVLGGVTAWNAIKAHFMHQFMVKNAAQPQTVSTTIADYSEWQPEVTAVGSLRAVHGVQVTAQLAGLVERVEFHSGQAVRAGQALVQLNAAPDIAQLHSLQATAQYAAVTYQREVIQYKDQAIGKATLDAATANWKSAEAQVKAQAALVAEKTIRAPFNGRLGITTVNPGQYLQPGTPIVSLQSLDPIYVDFYLPQGDLSRIHVGDATRVTAGAFAGRTFTGRVTSIDPLVDPSTRNFEAEATIDNPQRFLRPGMFVTTAVASGARRRYLTLPQTAISYNPYGDTVFVVKRGSGPKASETAEQVFVTLGPTRGDQIAVLKGIRAGDVIVTSGQLKLKNGSPVTINNTVQPLDNPNPSPQEH